MRIYIFIIYLLAGNILLFGQTNKQKKEKELTEYQKQILAKDTIDHDPWDIGQVGAERYYERYTPVIDPEYFLLGTLDTSWRFMGQMTENDIQIYNNEDEYRINYLKHYIEENFNIEVEVDRETVVSCLKSPEFAKMINDKYFEKNGRKLKTDIFHTKEQVCSFLLGAYFQSGGQRDKTYSIWTSEESTLIFRLLREANCTKILFLQGRGGIGVGRNSSFNFYPSVLLRKYFEVYNKQQEKMDIAMYGSLPDFAKNKEMESPEEKENRERYEKQKIRQEKVINEAFSIYDYFE
ncbi:MAG: hypothetical protein LIO93_09170 [Bacteroidales bacterium]|nr:hypothetical protein [Bacteroidales bacterium]